MSHPLQKFTEAHHHSFAIALAEIESGRKSSHWMWYIFPQIQGLGYSETAKFYAIRDIDEAVAYLKHPVLGRNLVEISSKLLLLDKTAAEIFGSPDDMKLRSCMTLFAQVKNADPVFQQILDKYFNGIPDARTLEIINKR